MERKRSRSSSFHRDNKKSPIAKRTRHDSNSPVRCTGKKTISRSITHGRKHHRRAIKFLHANDCIGNEDDVSEMKWHLNRKPQLLEQLRGNGDTSLISAVNHGHIKCVEFLIEKGVNLEAVDSSGNNALCCAVSKYRSMLAETNISKSKYYDIIKLLLQNGSNPNWEKISVTPPARVPLFTYLIISNFEELVELFLQYGIDLSNSCVSLDDGSDKHSHLYYAFREDENYNPNIIRLILDQGAEINFDAQDDLAVSLNKGRSESVKLILLYHAAPLVHGLHSPLHDLSYGLWTLHSDSSMEVRVKMLNILHKFGLNLWQNEGEFPLDTEDQVIFYDELSLLRNSPLSLKCLSRIAILHAMGRQYVNKYTNLEIPSTLFNFLDFSDV